MDNQAVQLDCGFQGFVILVWSTDVMCSHVFWSSKGQFIKWSPPHFWKMLGWFMSGWGLSQDPECGIDLDWPWLTLIAPEASCLHSKFTSWAVSRWDLRWNHGLIQEKKGLKIGFPIPSEGLKWFKMVCTKPPHRSLKTGPKLARHKLGKAQNQGTQT